MLKKFFTYFGLFFALSFVVTEYANAASVSVKCEVRSNRSKISIDALGVSGTFYAVVYSPPSVYVRSKLPNKVASSSTGYEVEFDFDSNSADVAAGATQIAYNYIKYKTVYGYLRRANDGLLVGSMKATCIAK